MRALMLNRLARDYAGCVLVDAPRPTPRVDEVLVRIEAASLGFPDLLMTRGGYQHKPALPHIMGGEMAGEIVACGDAAQAEAGGFSEGMRVVGGALGGGFAQYGAYRFEQLRPVPQGLSYAQAAATGSAYLTAYVSLVERAHLQGDEWVLVHGAGGGVGLAACDLACHLGARVIAASPSDEKLSQIGRLLPDCILLNTRDGFYERVREITDGGAGVIFDPVGGDVFDESLRCIAWGGRLLVVGFASGRIPDLPVNRALIKGVSVLGVRAGEYGRRDPIAGARVQEAIWQLAANGDIHPHVHAQMPLAAWRDAFALMETRRLIGRVIIAPHKD